MSDESSSSQPISSSPTTPLPLDEQNDDSTSNHQPSSLPPHAADHLVPESLLSIAKDVRYAQQCQELLSEFVTNFLELVGQQQGNDERSQTASSLQKQTWILSYALYAILVVAPLGRTLGMQAVGLTFGKATAGDDVAASGGKREPAITAEWWWQQHISQ